MSSKPFKFPPPLVPEKYCKHQALCHACNHSYQFPWEKPLEKPLTPKKEGSIYTMPRYIELSCPKCRTPNLIDVGPPSVEGDLFFYGDEAERHVSNKFLFSYSLVGGSKKIIESLEANLMNLKKEIEPSLDPESWRLHMAELWPSNSRVRHDIFRHWDIVKVNNVITRINGFLKSLSNQVWIYYFTGVFNSFECEGKKRKKAMDDCFSLVLLDLIDKSTGQKGRPHFFFDQTSRAKSATASEGWAEESFLGSQYSILYAFAAGSVPVDKPIFLEPGSHSMLELADFVAYCVSRYIYKRLKNEEAEPLLNPRNFGTATYSIYNPKKGMLFNAGASEYPWNEFFVSPNWG